MTTTPDAAGGVSDPRRTIGLLDSNVFIYATQDEALLVVVHPAHDLAEVDAGFGDGDTVYYRARLLGHGESSSRAD